MSQTLTRFTDRNGESHTIGYLPARGGRGHSGGRVLADEWEGQGLRLLCVMKPGDPETESHARALLREYARDLAERTTPLSRCVQPEELAQNGNGRIHGGFGVQ